jgi:zinc/manganese transport system substrate-binding protein
MRRAFLIGCSIAVLLASASAKLFAQPIRVITTTPDLADIARQIGRERVSVESLTRGVENIHAVPVKPSFVPKLNRADLLVVMGLDYEIAWLPALLEVANNPRILPGREGHIDCSVGVSVIDVPTALDRAEGDIHPKGNPHYHLDPVYGATIAKNIAAGFSRNFPQHRQIFEQNLNAYIAELEGWLSRWKEKAAPLRGVKFVGYHAGEWSYFANRFGLRQVGTIELKPGIEPTPGHLAKLVRTMRDEKVQLILYAAQSDRLPRQLAGQTGARAIRLPTMAGGAPGAESHIKMIDHNIRTLLAALKGA